MCLTLKKSARRQCAKRDIKVWKVLALFGDMELRSPFYKGCVWFKGCRKQSRLKRSHYAPRPFQYCQIDNGLHAFTNSIAANNYKMSDETVVELVIPKGSFYYVNRECSQIVATQMRWPSDMISFKDAGIASVTFEGRKYS